MATMAREPLTRSRILECALKLVDEEGVPALSMRRLGQELGVEAMSLYHHVPNKQALLEGVVDTVLGEFIVLAPDRGDWAERVRATARSYRGLAHAHPNAFPLLLTREFKTPESRRLMEAMVDLCRDAGFRDEEATLDAFCTLGSFVSGFALFEIGGFVAFAAGETGAAPQSVGGRCSPEDCPPWAVHGDAQFEFGLDVILTGLEARREMPRAPVLAGIAQAPS